MTATQYPTEWLRGTLPYAVLGALSEQPRHGYAVAAWLEHRGLGAVKGGTLYPLLSRLERDGLVEARWEPGRGGPGRKVFALTEAGRAHLQHAADAWQRFSTTLASALGEASDTKEEVR